MTEAHKQHAGSEVPGPLEHSETARLLDDVLVVSATASIGKQQVDDSLDAHIAG